MKTNKRTWQLTRKRPLLPLLMIFIFFSCVPDPIVIELEEAPSRLVISSHAIGTQTLLVTVTRSFSALTPATESDTTETVNENTLNDVLVKNAVVTIAYEDVTDTLIEVDSLPGFYFSFNVSQKENTLYQLKVSDPATGQTVSSSTYFTPRIDLNNVYPRVNYEDSIAYLNYSFTDPAEEANWYVLEVFKVSVPLDKDPDEAFFDIYQSATRKMTTLLKDVNFEDNVHADEFRLNGFNPGDTVGITFSHISEDYYKFLLASYESQNSITALISSEPVNRPTNIVNGYGHFNLRKPTLRFLVLK
jgi:hypothetical protein